MIATTRTGTRLWRPAFVFLALTLLLPGLRAQIGNNNPTGPAGAFNGNITTGCSYDPFTGNTTRSITDLVVTGAVGKYPLTFTRTANSRYLQAGQFGFGQAGGWRHSYAWEIDDSEPSNNPSARPTVYSVFFPDGRIINFSGSPSDPYFQGPPGVQERFQPMNASEIAYLILADGGKVEFKGTRIIECDYELIPPCEYSYSYRAQAIIDPHGLRTDFFYNQDGSLDWVQEPAGRWIQLFYATTWWINSNGYPDRVIDHVLASDGRVVQYYYEQAFFSPGTSLYTRLSSVVYPFEPALNLSPTAFYTYQAPNGPNPNGYPLLSSCDDPMYAGPMKKISYTYATENGDPIVPVVVGQILSENNGNTGQIVSRLYVPFIYWRTEIRGDGPPGGNGPSRTFEYPSAYLWRYTDFQGHYSTISYENGYVSAFQDARNHTTSYQRYSPNGALAVLTHPDPEQSTQTFAYREVDSAPYFLEIRGDERLVNGFNSNTFFTRDPVTHRVTKIWYPDYPSGPTEEFTYTPFGQVETHTMTSGGVQNFRYDGRGLMYESWPPTTPSDPDPEQHKTRYFYYTSGPNTDRLWYVIDPRNNTTSFDYNTRGQVTKVTHADGKFRQNGYNADGTLAWTADENHPNASWNPNERTRYLYDDYKRVISVTNPVDPPTTLSYAPPNGAGSHSHTTGSVYRVTSPLGKKTDFDYDENFRRKMVRKGAESADDDGGTWFDYDEVGNLRSVRDPRGHSTTFGYDERNRRTSATDPVPFTNQITRWEYDTRSNLKKETRPDLSFRRMEYDPQSRVIDTYGFANEHTHYKRDLAGNVIELTDPKPATYFFGYDQMNRKISATYPLDATNTTRGETWHYDWAGNMDLYRNPAFQYRHVEYDPRNRPWHSYWNWSETSTVPDWFGPEITNGFDDASRLTSVATKLFGTNDNETLVSFGYDDANRQIWEEQTVAGFPTRRVETPRNDDGFRHMLHVPGFYMVRSDYTQRGQLRTIYDSNFVPWINYSYDLAGNMTKRQGAYGGVNDSTNILDGAGVSQYDALNRPMMWEQSGVANQWFARSHFNYDNLGRLTASWREEQQNKGEWFAYEATGSLKEVAYNADEVWNAPPLHATRRVSYTMTPDTLNRSSMDDSGVVSAYTPNALNQYQNVAGGEMNYDGNFNLIWGGPGFSASYDAMNRLISAQSSEDTAEFVYDGLGRCLKRKVSWETIQIAYDGWKPIVEWDEWGFRKAWNVYGAGPDEILWRYADSSGHLRYHLDRMGNVAFLLDGDGVVVEKYTYDAFGLPTVTDGKGENPRPYSWYGNRFMFTGREYFPELGIYDYRNRFYHPILGRFLQSDPIGFGGGDANLFRYCAGNPVNGTDPYGLKEELKKPLEAFTAPIVIFGSRVETAMTAGMGPQGPASPLDYSGAAPGEGSARDGGGGDGFGINSPLPTIPPQELPPVPTPTPPNPAIPPNPKPYNWQPAKDYATDMMLYGGGAIVVGVGLEFVPSGVTQVVGGGLIVGGAVVGTGGVFLYIGATQKERREGGQ